MANLTDWIGSQAPTTDPLRLTQGQSQPSYLDRYMQDRQKRVEEIDQMSPLRRFFGPGMERQDIMLELIRAEDMKRKQGATQVQAEAELRKQQAEMQKQGREARAFIFDKLDKLEKLPPDKRSSVAPVYAELIGDMLDMSGAKNASQIKKLVTAAFNNPATGKLLRSQMADSAYEEHDFQEITDQLGLQDEAQWTSVFDKKRAAKVKEYERTISVALPQFVARLKAKGVAAPTPGDLMTHAEGALGELGKSAIVREAYVNVVNGMTAEQQTAMGLTPGKVALAGMVKKAEDLAQGPKVDVMTSTGLATQGLTPGTATPAQIAEAEKGAQQKRVEVSAAQGAGAVTAKAGAERDLPLVQSTLKEGNDTIIDRTTGNPVDPFTTTLKDIQAGGGQKRYARLNDKQFQAYQAVAESRTILDEFETVVKDFATKPGANLAQAVEFYAKTKLGVDNPGVALDALNGSILRFAGAMQGSRVQISDQDRESVKAMVPQKTDSFDVAMKRIRMTRRIFDAMQKVQMGDMSNAKVIGAIEDAKKETASLIKIKGSTRLE